jgi:two-component system response regulator AtoC
MTAVRALVQKVAPTSSTVLITGESVTGKEVVARLLHSLSANPQGPFAAINIGGIPDTLLESELFGFERGAFTGAVERKRGMLELASSGTLFLDEIGDMPLPLQVKLLRVLQEKKIQRLGGTSSIPLNARIIAATNRVLETLLREGKFREDLYYRLNVIRIEIPPLRERREDIPALAGFFVEKLNREMGRKIKGLDPEAGCGPTIFPATSASWKTGSSGPISYALRTSSLRAISAIRSLLPAGRRSRGR